MIYSVGNSLSIAFQYEKSFNDENQYLRRVYKQTGVNGKQQIVQRIKVVSKYYEDNDMISSDVPMMIINKMKDIFVKRKRRLNKIKMNQENSQSSKQESFGNASLSLSLQSDFLNQVHLNFSQLMDSSLSSIDSQKHYDPETHNIYTECSVREIQIQLRKIQLNQNQVQHLICDFEEIDVQSVINFYKDIKKTNKGSIIMSQIMEQEHKMNKRNSQKCQKQENSKFQNKSHKQIPFQISKKGSTISKQSILSSYISVFGKKSKSKEHKFSKPKQNRYSAHLLANQCVDQYKKIWQYSIQNAEQQTERRKQNRQKVRLKAQKLLEKIKKESFTSEIR